MLEMMGTPHCFFTDEKDNTTQPKMVCAFSLSNSSLIFGLSALFLRIVSVGYVVSSGMPESWTFIQRLYISYIPDFGDLIRGVDIFIKTSLGC